MNWSRGFFRAWVVVSILYIAVAALLTDFKPFKELFFKPAIYQVELNGGTKREFDSSKPKNELIKEIEFAFNEDILALTRAGRAKDAEDIRQNYRSRIDEVHKLVVTGRDQLLGLVAFGIAAIIVPPLILFALGLALKWTLSGFKTQA